MTTAQWYINYTRVASKEDIKEVKTVVRIHVIIINNYGSDHQV